MPAQLENRFYYLDNFLMVIRSINARYRHLFTIDEQTFLDSFIELPQAASALAVRMIMRKGTLFRLSKLNYDEIGCIQSAALPLLAAGWITDQPLLTVDQLFTLLKKNELFHAFPLLQQHKNVRKGELLPLFTQLHVACSEDQFARTLLEWSSEIRDTIFQVHIRPLADRIRLMFFGNLRQDWSDFVLAELGIFKYEQVDLSPVGQAFNTRKDIDDYLHLHTCRERFHNEELADTIVADIPPTPHSNEWVEQRRTKLLFQIARTYERDGALSQALQYYSASSWPDARVRSIRVMERTGLLNEALERAQYAKRHPENEAEIQQLQRITPRLLRKLRIDHHQEADTVFPQLTRHDVVLNKSVTGRTVEFAMLDHLSGDDAQVFYVENTLINSLFGLLFWDAIFAPVPGAFFHPFQNGPADLHSPIFRQNRSALFDALFAQLDTEEYKQTILHCFQMKENIQSPFVFWGAINKNLLDIALACLPPLHLKRCFERILQDTKENCTGLPDLIQFWPAEKRYRMIEVKGPGDRLQDNQIRWLHYFSMHDIPAIVCHVQWADETA